MATSTSREVSASARVEEGRVSGRRSSAPDPKVPAHLDPLPPRVAALIHSNNGATVKLGNNDGHTPLMAAAKNGHAATVRLLLQSRAQINRMDRLNNTPLLYACEWGAEDCVQVLLGAQDCTRETVQAENKQGQTPLSIAKGHGDEQAVSALEDFIERHNQRGRNPSFVLRPSSTGAGS